MSLIEGSAAFSVLTETDVYNGKDTGMYKLTLVLDDVATRALEEAGVIVKEYEGMGQRAFKSKFPVSVVDVAGEPVKGEIPRGSKVRVQYAYGPPNGEYGVPVYLNKVRVLEFAEDAAEDDDGF